MDGVDYAAASELVGYFEEETTELPVTEKLPEPVNPDTTVAFLDNGSTVAAMMWESVDAAAQRAGVKSQRVDAGFDAQSVNAAVNTVTENAPDILIAAAVDATFFQNQLSELEEAGTTVVYVGSSNADEFGLLDSHSGLGASRVNGEVLAAGAIAFTCGTGTDFVFYRVPELNFSDPQLEAAQAFLEENCEECELRVVDIPAATMDTTASDAIVSDLQANPDTDFFITVGDQMQIGLPAKQELAGIDVPGMGQSSLPPNIEQIKGGSQTAGFAVDYNAYSWFAFDEGLRRHQGLEVSYDDWQPWVKAISRILTPETAGEYEGGFVASPTMEDDFAALWGAD
ncbi:sugar ABC transporter substrate-binding protein [Kocuria sp. M1N1S27]|uniref:sugar ABC transporter substrate-binding protein n=1 Tax=Kocuria kalidii TaxID=3376283 RepID=UPI00379948E4